MSDTWNSIFTGTIGGLIVLGIQEIVSIYRKKKSTKTERVIKSRDSNKIITNSVLYDLRPGANIELMRELLGTPVKFNKSDYPLFQENEVVTNSYLYIFHNASLKITSKDNLSIDSLTVIGYDSSIELESISFESEDNEYRLTKTKVCSEILENLNNHDFVQTRIDASFALQKYIPNPLYQYFTYFGSSIEKGFMYREKNDPNVFLNEIIDGFCVSNNSEDTYFIFDMESR